MSTTLKKEIEGVRSELSDSLDQNPTTGQIIYELEGEYQHISNLANNTGVAWSIDEIILTTVANQFDYRIDTETDQFYKPLHLEILPEGIELSDESAQEDGGKHLVIDYTNSLKGTRGYLEFMEIEHLPLEYQWLQSVGGQLFFNTRYSFYMAFYRQIFPNVGEAQFVRLSPIPTISGINIKIMYQTTDWWDAMFSELTTGTDQYQQKMPHSSQRFYIRSLVAKNLIYKEQVAWSTDIVKNTKKRSSILQGLDDKIIRYRPAFEDYIRTLEETDSITIDAWDCGEYI